MRRFFVEETTVAKGQVLVLSENESYHCVKVLRLRKGAHLTLFNDTGAEYDAEIVQPDRRATHVMVLEERFPDVEAALKIALAVSLLKSPKMDWLLQKAVELGTDRLIPFFSSRTVVKQASGHEEQGKIRRWKKIIQAASKQCGRVRCMKIEPLSSLNRIIKDSDQYKIKLAAVEREATTRLGETLNGAKPVRDANLLVVIGPEGGWDDNELTLLKDADFRYVSLGRRILRSETAALAALSVIMSWAHEL